MPVRSDSVSEEALKSPVTESSETQRHYRRVRSIVSTCKWHWLPYKIIHTKSVHHCLTYASENPPNRCKRYCGQYPFQCTQNDIYLRHHRWASYNRDPHVTTGVCAFSLTSLVAQRDAGIGIGASGSRILRRPGGLGRGGRLAAAFPGMAARRVPARWMIRGWCPSPARDPDRGHLRHSAMRFASGQDDGPRAACSCGRRCQRYGSPGRPCWRQNRTFTAPSTSEYLCRLSERERRQTDRQTHARTGGFARVAAWRRPVGTEWPRQPRRIGRYVTNCDRATWPVVAVCGTSRPCLARVKAGHVGIAGFLAWRDGSAARL